LKLAKAIENLYFLSTSGAPKLRLEEIESVKLGIEALKAVQRTRNPLDATHTLWLPGETKEDCIAARTRPISASSF